MGKVILGLDLGKIRFSAFKHDRMFDKRYYLRSRRLIVYQLAMIITVCAESTATYSLSKYVDTQRFMQRETNWSQYNNDIIGVGSFTIWAGVFTAIVYGTMFFFLVFWPTLHETRMWYRIKLAAATFCTVCVFAAAVSSTVIGATRSAYFYPRTENPGPLDTAKWSKPPLRYRDYDHVIAWLILLWLGFIPVVWSNILVHQASQYHLANPTKVDDYERETMTEKKVPRTNDTTPSETV